MKTDRFVKVMLVIIAGLLLLNCFKDNGGGVSVPFMETKAKASVPAFLEVGKSYGCLLQGADPNLFKAPRIVNIDKESGWIEVEGDKRFWINTAQLKSC